MAEAVYILCALTSMACMVLLFSRYRRTRVQLLFWSAAAFFFFTANNILLFIDLVVTPNTDLSVLRTVVNLAGVSILLYGLIKER